MLASLHCVHDDGQTQSQEIIRSCRRGSALSASTAYALPSASTNDDAYGDAAAARLHAASGAAAAPASVSDSAAAAAAATACRRRVEQRR